MLLIKDSFHFRSHAAAPINNQRRILFFLMYDRNPYFCLGSIPKLEPKLANIFGQYRSRYQNYISKGESSYQWFFFNHQGSMIPRYLHVKS